MTAEAPQSARPRKEYTALIVASGGPNLGRMNETRHVYLSTACLHAGPWPAESLRDAQLHAYCRAEVGVVGAKTPGMCKFCDAQCVCPCHRPRLIPAHRA